MLDDLFSHKIHATDLEEWSRILVRLAEVYSRFDGAPYNREQLGELLSLLAPAAARDAFRDQFSIYMSILGVGHIVWDEGLGGWRVRVTETARQFLLGIEPDVEAFCRLQLALYQRPDGRGLSYEGAGRHEHQSATHKLQLIHDGYRVCPFRLILGMIGAKARVEGISESNVEVTPQEIYAFANDPVIRAVPTPSLQLLSDAFGRLTRGRMNVPRDFERRFKFLEATGLVTIDTHSVVRLRDWGNDAANSVRDSQVTAIRNLRAYFNRFERCRTSEDLLNELKLGRWARYFDAVNTLQPTTVETIAGRNWTARLVVRGEERPVVVVPRGGIQPGAPGATVFQGGARRAARTPQPQADPEETRIRRERRNAMHDLILRRLAAKVRGNGLVPRNTALIDLFTNVESVRASLPGRFTTRQSYLQNQELPYFPSRESDEISFMFEAKSSDDEIIVDQVRKAVGQLYEYRYRYSGTELRPHVVLVLALERHFRNFPWIAQYLLSDRRIGVCWLGDDLQRLICPRECMPVLQSFVDEAEG